MMRALLLLMSIIGPPLENVYLWQLDAGNVWWARGTDGKITKGKRQ